MGGPFVPCRGFTLSTVCVGVTVTRDVVPTIGTLLPPPLMQQSASMIAIGTLGSELAGIGSLLATLGSGTAWRTLGWVWRFSFFFAFAIADFSAAIFVNNSVSFLSASAILLLHETVPFNALVRSNAAFMRSVLGVTCGFIIYWCLKNTMSLILVAPGFHNVDVEALVMLHCCPDVETGVRMNIPGLSVLGLDVGHHHASQRCEQAFHVIVLPVDMGICWLPNQPIFVTNNAPYSIGMGIFTFIFGNVLFLPVM
jgi:hypothetical protein